MRRSGQLVCYRNRIDGRDIDLTRAQFVDGQEVREIDVVSDAPTEPS